MKLKVGLFLPAAMAAPPLREKRTREDRKEENERTKNKILKNTGTLCPFF